MVGIQDQAIHPVVINQQRHLQNQGHGFVVDE